MVIVAEVILQSSVIVTVYVPADKPVTSAVEAPFDHEYVYDPVPPVAVTVAAPFEPP